MTGMIRKAVPLLALVLAWAGISSTGWVGPDRLASPQEVALRIRELASAGLLLPALGRSLLRLVAGYGLALLLGLALGYAMARKPWVGEGLGSLVLSFQSLPSICWTPLALIWFGPGEASVLFVVVMGSFVTMALATQSSIRNIPPLILEAARTLGARGWDYSLRVMLPAALPGMITGMKLAWAFAWRSLMGAEMLVGKSGLGAFLTGGWKQGDVAVLLGIMAMILSAGILVDQLFSRWETRVQKLWGFGR